MKIRWYGHACFSIGDFVITDPHDGHSIGLSAPTVKGDIILVSHDHYDHNCVNIVKKSDSKIFDVPGTFTEPGISIAGIKTYHDDVRGEKRGENIIFKFVINGIRFCHLGDLGHILSKDTISELGEIDILFVPVGNVFTLGPSDAWKTSMEINPKIVVPMHYRIRGLSLSIKPVNKFLENISKDIVKHVGYEVDIDSTDIPDMMEVWVFSF
jgi:L-ascorbate metabolism protein UlaG (beta-lactamase superfamily)